MSVPSRRLEFQRDAALAEIVMPEIKAAIGMRLVVVKGSDFARRAAAGRLDLDYVGAGAGEQLAAKLALLIAQFKNLTSNRNPSDIAQTSTPNRTYHRQSPHSTIR